ncbi:MAG TPA: sigma-E factor negative regulatory protein [Gammaproteobacteria bacterium]
MSEQIHDQVSAFIDDELSAEECAFLVRRFERDPASRSKLVRYSLIGSALRGELLQPDPDMLRRRVHNALHGVPSTQRPAAASPPAQRKVENARWASPTVGLGLAASVAVAAIFVVREMNGGDDTSEAATPVMSTVVPADTSPSPRVVAPLPPIRLTNYLLHHGEYARLSRTSVHSTVIGSMEQPLMMEAVMVDDAPPQIEGEAR